MKAKFRLFSFVDKTGRGFKETLTEQQVKSWFVVGEDEERSDQDETIAEWLQDCEAGDKWETAEITLTSIN